MYGTAKNDTVLNKSERKKLTGYKKKYNYSETKSFQSGIKRAIDITHSVAGLILTAPVLLASSIAIKLDSKGPVIFRQERIGKDGKPFTIYKLRTMRTDADEKALLNPDDKRVTRVGKFLRKYSIDEFPQLINVLKGDMSLVGPRPLSKTTHDMRRKDKNFIMRYTVKPGATLEYSGIKIDDIPNERIKTEKDYIEHWSLKNDLKTFVNTISRVIKGENY